MTKEQFDIVLRNHDIAYYVQGTPSISDQEYDTLVRDYESRFGTRSVVGHELDVNSEGTVVHQKPVLSLKKVYTAKDARKRLLKWLKTSGRESLDICIEPKIDGISLTTTYTYGHLTQFASRGDGRKGENCSRIFPYIQGIPSFVAQFKHKESVSVRGELYIPVNTFQRLKDLGFANPRNLAAGSVHVKDLSLLEGRNLTFVAYYADFTSEGSHHRTLGNLDQFILPWSFKTSITKDITEKEIEDLITDKRPGMGNSLEFETDGLVIKLDDLSICSELGESRTHPHHAFAIKETTSLVRTTVRDIKFSMGMSGVLTPVAHFDTVELYGTNVSKATLHNFENLKTLRVGVGSEISVTKAGMIIPQIKEVHSEGEGPAFENLKECPFCKSSIKLVGPNITCSNTNECDEVIVSKIKYAVSRKILDIKGLGEQTIRKLVEELEVTHFLDLYYLYQWKDHPGKNPISEKLLEAIKRSEKVEFYRILSAFAVPNLGPENCHKYFTTLDKFLYSRTEDLPKSIRKARERAISMVEEFYYSLDTVFENWGK